MHVGIGSTVAARKQRSEHLPGVDLRLLGWALAGALVVLSTLVRTRWLDVPLWGDEAISLGIAAHPVSELATLLGYDYHLFLLWKKRTWHINLLLQEKLQ